MDSQQNIRALESRLAAIETLLRNVKGRPVIRSSSGKILDLNANLDVQNMLARLAAIDGGSVNGVNSSWGGGVSDHGGLSGLGDDDHLIYFLTDGARQLTGDLDIAATKVVKINSKQIIGARQSNIADAGIDATTSHAITDPAALTSGFAVEDALSMVSFGLINADADSYAVGIVTFGMWDSADAAAQVGDLRDDLVANAIPDMESALNALGTKLNAVAAVVNYILDMVRVHGLIEAGTWSVTSAPSIVSFGLINPGANSYAAGIVTFGMFDYTT